MTYGTTTTIKSSRCQVSLPQDIDDTSARCPGFDSLEEFENGMPLPVTTLSYQRFKFRLYQIAEPIMGEIYFHNGCPLPDLIEKVQDINRQLLEWEKRVPPELRPKSFASSPATSRPDRLTKIFQLQALALQLSYDNIQLILHRPLLVYNGVLSLGPRLSRPPPPESSAGFWEASKELCWNSTRRTSCVDEYPTIVKLMRNFHGAAHIGIQTFTAGVMLGIFALSKPFSPQAQEAKRSIGRLIKMPKLLGYRTTISDQTGRILERLLRLILDQELKVLTSDEAALTMPSRSVDPDPGSNNITMQNNPNVGATAYYDKIADSNLTDVIPRRDQADSSTVHPTPTGMDSSQQLAGHDTVASTIQGDQGSNIATAATLFNPYPGSSFFDSDFLGELDDLGQGWMWEDCYQFT